MRVSGVLVGIGIVLIAMSGLVEGAALVRYVQDEPQLLLPLPCDQSLPVLIGTRLRLQALTDGVDHPMEVTVQWLARDGNGVVLGQGTTAVTPGHDSLLGVVPSGNRRELHLLAQVVRGTPRQAWLRVRPDAVSAATLALGGIALFVVGELALGLGTVLSVWRSPSSSGGGAGSSASRRTRGPNAVPRAASIPRRISRPRPTCPRRPTPRPRPRSRAMRRTRLRLSRIR